jgi:hypothetical protein
MTIIPKLGKREIKDEEKKLIERLKSLGYI